MPRRKSNVKDAACIASLLMKGMFKDRFVPQKNMLVVRAYERRYVLLLGQMNPCLQQIEQKLNLILLLK